MARSSIPRVTVANRYILSSPSWRELGLITRREDDGELVTTASSLEQRHLIDEIILVRGRQLLTQDVESGKRPAAVLRSGNAAQLHPITPPLTLSDAELSDLQILLADLPSLWRHPLVSNEQRKAMIRTIIRRVDATPGPEAWTLAITWASGASTNHILLTEPGKRAQLTEAFACISSRFADGASVPQITRELNAAQLGQGRGPWTVGRVRNIITLLQRGAIQGVPPLRVRRAIAARIRALYDAGLTAEEILARLREEGAVTLLNRPVPIEHVHQVLRRVRARRASPRLDPVGNPAETKEGAQAEAARTPTGDAMAPDLLVFTARYSNPNIVGSGLVPVGIARYSPTVRPAYERKANLYDLAPTAGMIARRKSGALTEEEFVAEYEQQLERISLPKILQQLTRLQGRASGIVLLCFEDVSVGESCHRRMLADWLRRQAGLAVAELPDPGRKKTRKTAAPVLEEHHDLEQVRALLGHARMDTTQLYASIRPPQLSSRCRSTRRRPYACWPSEDVNAFRVRGTFRWS